jgi:hypothetical protein
LKNNMTNITENKSKKNQIFLIALASLLGGLLLYTFTGVNGVGMSPDSANYISAARSLVHGKGFIDILGKPFVSWPPFFSILIACFKIFQIDYVAALRLINILSFAVIIFSSSLLIFKNTESLTLSLINAVIVIFSKPLFFVSTHGWSEPLFVAEICLFMLILSYCSEKMDYKIVLLAIIAIAYNLTRYPGLILTLVGCLYIFFRAEGTYLRRIIKAGVWGFLTVVPLAIWLVRNYILEKTLTGEKLEGTLTLSHNLDLTGRLIGYWFLPLSLAQIMSGWVVFTLLIIILLSLTIFILYKFLVRKINPFYFPVTGSLLFIWFYGFMIIASVTTTVLSPLSDRYLAPLFVPILYILLYFLYIAAQNVISGGKNLKSAPAKLTLLIILAIFAGVWLASEINIVTVQAYNAYYKGFEGDNEKSYQKSELFAWVKENKPEGKLYCNALCPLFVWTYCESDLPPYKYLADGGTPEVSRKKSEQSVISFKNSLEENEKVYLIWHLPNIRKNLYELDELQKFCNMKLVEKFSDGFVFELYSLSRDPGQLTK